MAQTRFLAFVGCLLILEARGRPLDVSVSPNAPLDTLASQTTHVGKPEAARSPSPGDLVLSTPAREKSTYESKSAIITKAGDDEPFVVGKGTTITFVAGEEIRLTGEFKAEEGSQFRASISEIAMSNLDSESENLRIQFELSQNYPNPFNPETVIQYSVPTSEAVFQVTLKLYDITGREVATFVNAEQKAGRYEIKFNGQRFSSGIYFYRLSVIQEGSKSDLTDVKKMMLIK